ncbi:MAG: hypothetical protein HGA71_20550, partial [Azonexaceae bacterium]|nr:hypothetical protein [Azonexaceae bacterium]
MVQQLLRAGWLTAKEMAVLRLLAEAHGEPVSRERFLDVVWGYAAFPTTRTVDRAAPGPHDEGRPMTTASRGSGRGRGLAGIRKKFGKKGAEVVQGNENAFAAGVQYAEAHPLREPRTLQAAGGAMTEGKLVVDGNDMCAAAAIFAGCEFFGGYPITPSSEIMHFFGREVWKHGGVMMQCEDEIAGIGAVVGASFAGKKAMTATSGPGMSLKTEMLGLASIAELPLVCVNVQRGGPSTGIPTKSEQSDLFQACFSAHGDVVRPVLAPVSVADTFGVTVEAFNVAEH